MRDWNSCLTFPFQYTHNIFSLPMRDWNVSGVSGCGVRGRNFQPTYEGLKLRLVEDGIIFWVWFSAYLWGIETFTKPNLPISLDRDFQPTYEGLKLALNVLRWGTGGNFQPTYEGLKPELAYKQIIKDVYFQPTYEGLKQNLFPSPEFFHLHFQPTYEGLKLFSYFHILIFFP